MKMKISFLLKEEKGGIPQREHIALISTAPCLEIGWMQVMWGICFPGVCVCSRGKRLWWETVYLSWRDSWIFLWEFRASGWTLRTALAPCFPPGGPLLCWLLWWLTACLQPCCCSYGPPGHLPYLLARLKNHSYGFIEWCQSEYEQQLLFCTKWMMQFWSTGQLTNVGSDELVKIVDYS